MTSLIVALADAAAAEDTHAHAHAHSQPKELCPAQQILRLFDEVTYAYQVVVTLNPGISPSFG